MISAGCIALEALRAGVPARHDAVGIEHVDGVVGHRLDEQAIATLIGQGRHETVEIRRLGVFHEALLPGRQHWVPKGKPTAGWNVRIGLAHASPAPA